MKRIIHNLRRQPEHIRRHVLHVSTMVAGVILLVLWIYSLGTNFSNPDTQTKINNDLKPFSALKDNLVGGYQSLNMGN
ncbi:hypothetical protein HYZ82_02310 [Candidatus Nomurabacteria bacterium]|nr:hypothetical protein [Candidatus Nomurabacteria bacterium]